MAKLNILVANAAGAIEEETLKTAKSAARKAWEYSKKKLDISHDVDLILTESGFLSWNIPEDKVGGRAYSNNLVVLSLDSGANYNEIFMTTCHELNHAERWNKNPEFADTLFKNMILEGMAVYFEIRATKDILDNNAVSFFQKTVLETSSDELSLIKKELKPLYDKTEADYNFRTYFYLGDENIPRWAGYKLGYYIVKEYIEKNKIESFAELAKIPYSDFE